MAECTVKDDQLKKYLLTAYIKPKGGKTWILPKVMDIDDNFSRQTLAFRFPSEDDAKVFHNIFDTQFRNQDVDAKQAEEERIKFLTEENAKLHERKRELEEGINDLREMQETLKEQLGAANVDAAEIQSEMNKDAGEDAYARNEGFGAKQASASAFGASARAVSADMPTRSSPHTYSVKGDDGITVRAGESLDTDEVDTLPRNTEVTVVDIRGRRAHITTPVEGWVSLHTKSGYVCLEKVDSEVVRERAPAAEKPRARPAPAARPQRAKPAPKRPAPVARASGGAKRASGVGGGGGGRGLSGADMAQIEAQLQRIVENSGSGGGGGGGGGASTAQIEGLFERYMDKFSGMMNSRLQRLQRELEDATRTSQR